MTFSRHKISDNTIHEQADPANIWLLMGHKAGDNNQVLALAEAIDQAFEIKHFHYCPHELLTNRLLQVTLAGIDRKRSSALIPPWPALVITAGRRNEPVARWIQQQSGGTTRIVHIGRPWAELDAFDLIITTPQYFLPEQDNVLQVQLPLHRLSSAKLEAAAAEWRERLKHLPRPYTVLLVGGDSGPFVFTPAKGQRLGTLANQHVQAYSGSLLISNSARTPASMFAALQQQLTVPTYIHHWGGSAEENPYLAFLGLADRLIVTGESMSMLTEASSTNKPVYIFDPTDADPRWWRYPRNFHHKPLSYHLAMRFGPRRMRRDVGNIQRALVASGRAVWLGEPVTAMARAPANELQSAVRRVRVLLEQPRSVA
ncbi:MAG: mitochondrial fission ELM1 family protein [Pseudomonadales bacterium]